MAVKPALWCAAVAVLGVAADAASKAWALSRLSGGRDITRPIGPRGSVPHWARQARRATSSTA
jgi:hypothetical protein